MLKRFPKSGEPPSFPACPFPLFLHSLQQHPQGAATPPGSAPTGVAFIGGLSELLAIQPAVHGVRGGSGNPPQRHFPQSPPPCHTLHKRP